MYFLEKNRRWSRGNETTLEASLVTELQFYEQKAKEMAEVLYTAHFFNLFLMVPPEITQINRVVVKWVDSLLK